MLSLTVFEIELQTKGGSQICYVVIVCFSAKGQNFLVREKNIYDGLWF